MSRPSTARPVVIACVALLLVGTAAVPAGAAARHPVPSPVTSSHRVEAGDTLSELASRFGTTVRELAALNGLSNPDRIVIGRSLRIPAGSGVPSPRASVSSTSVSRSVAGARHTVARGETLGGIAARHGLDVADLARWNGVTNGVIYASTALVLYDPGPLPDSSIVCPVPGGRFFNDWAFPRSGGRAHVGTDLFAARGTPVVAPVSGTVTTEQGPLGGLQFWLSDSGGNRWMGSHLDAFGNTGHVHAGDVVGYVGDSGNARGSDPHLHLEYHPAGRGPVNLFPVLRAAC